MSNTALFMGESLVHMISHRLHMFDRSDGMTNQVMLMSDLLLLIRRRMERMSYELKFMNVEAVTMKSLAFRMNPPAENMNKDVLLKDRRARSALARETLEGRLSFRLFETTYHYDQSLSHSHSFGRLKDAELSSFGSQLLMKMTDNQYFLDPTPSLAQVDQDLKNYREALENSICGGGRIATSLKKTARQKLSLTLRTLASYVQSKGQNDLNIMASSGFNLWKDRSPVGDLAAPDSLRYRYIKSGEIYIYFARVHRAANYRIQIALSLSGPWEDRAISTSTRVTIKDLVPGTRYWFASVHRERPGPAHGLRPSR